MTVHLGKNKITAVRLKEKRAMFPFKNGLRREKRIGINWVLTTHRHYLVSCTKRYLLLFLCYRVKETKAQSFKRLLKITKSALLRSRIKFFILIPGLFPSSYGGTKNVHTGFDYLLLATDITLG